MVASGHCAALKYRNVYCDNVTSERPPALIAKAFGLRGHSCSGSVAGRRIASFMASSPHKGLPEQRNRRGVGNARDDQSPLRRRSLSSFKKSNSPVGIAKLNDAETGGPPASAAFRATRRWRKPAGAKRVLSTKNNDCFNDRQLAAPGDPCPSAIDQFLLGSGPSLYARNPPFCTIRCAARIQAVGVIALNHGVGEGSACDDIFVSKDDFILRHRSLGRRSCPRSWNCPARRNRRRARRRPR